MADEQTPWVVKGVPARTRKLVKMYAVEHDMTMARAIEAIVDSAHHSHNQRLLDALLEMRRRVLVDDMAGAKRAAENARQFLEPAKLE